MLICLIRLAGFRLLGFLLVNSKIWESYPRSGGYSGPLTRLVMADLKRRRYEITVL